MPAFNHIRDLHSITKVIAYSSQITGVINIAERLRAAREEAKLSQGQLASMAGVAQGTIGNIENGTRRNPRELLAIARALGVQAEWLKSGTGSRHSRDSELPETERSVVLKMAFRAGVVQGGDNGFIEDYEPHPTEQEHSLVPYASIKADEKAYAVKVRGNSMEPTIMAGWDVVASPSRPAQPPDLCVVHFADQRKALKRLLWVRDGTACLESINSSHKRLLEPTESIVRMDKVISIVPN